MPSFPTSERREKSEQKLLLLAEPPGWQWGGATQLLNKGEDTWEIIPMYLTSVECGDARTSMTY